MKSKPNRNEQFPSRRRATAFLLKAAAAVLLLAILVWAPGVPGAEKAVRNEGVLRATLKNGLRVVIVENKLASVVTTEVNYLAGSNEAPEGFPGMAHAQEHMMFRGSPGLSADQLADITAAMGGEFNADTQQTVTQYFFTVPADELDLALHIEALRMGGVLDTDALWTEERGAIEQEVAQDLSNPQYVFYTKLLAAMFKGTPYAHDALGTRPSFDKTTGAMLRKFHESWYAPNNAILVIAGNVDPQATLKEVETLFGPVPAKKVPAHPEVKLEAVQPDTLNLTTDLPYGLAVVCFRLPGSDSPDYAAAQVLGDVLSSQRWDLYGLVPQGKALYAGFEFSALPKAGLGFALAVFPKGADPAGLVKEMKGIMAQAVEKGLPADLVEAAKRKELTSSELEKNSVSGLAQAWSQALAVEGRSSPNDDMEAMEKVTPAEVDRVAKHVLDQNHAIVAILTPQPSGKPLSSKGFGGQESFAPKNPKAVTLPPWAEKALGRLAVPASVVNPTVTTLPNGLKLVVQPESVSNTVSVFGQVRNQPDLETPKGQEGTGQVLDRLFSFGTTTLDRLAFQKALDDIGAQEFAGTSFSVEALSTHFDRAVQLLADNELNPALPEQAFKIMQAQTARSVAGLLQSPLYLSNRALDEALYPKDDPSLREATPKTVSSLTLQDVKAYYATVFRPDLTTIVVMGQVTPEEAEAAVEKYFGGWKAEGPKPETVLPAVPPNKASATGVPDSSRVQDDVTLAETLGLDRANPDYYALELGNHVLGGAFYATRLYRDLREKGGLVYYVSSTFDVGQKRSIYVVRYACDPPNVSKAQAMVVRELKSMSTAPVTPVELQKAKSLVLREIPLSESSVDRIARGLISRSIHDLPLDEPTRAARKYLALTAPEIQAAYARWLRPDDLVRVTLGPEAK
jgi:zinc protease